MAPDNDDAASRGMRRLLRTRSHAPPILPASKEAPSREAQAQIVPATTLTGLAPLCVRILVAAQMLGIGRTKVYELINAGELETIKLGESVLITTASLASFVARHAQSRSGR